MSVENAVEAETTPKPASSDAVQKKQGKSAPSPKTSKPAKINVGAEQEFSGRVSSVGIKTVSAAGFQLRFTLNGKKASKNVFVLDGADAAKSSALLHLVTNAFKKDSKVKGRSVTLSAGEQAVLDFEIRS